MAKSKNNLPKNPYWRERLDNEMVRRIKDEEIFRKELNKLYRSTQRTVENEINAFLGRYAGREGISITEARKRVTLMDVEAFADKAARYVKEKNFSPEANAELKIYNLAMRMSRAELLNYHIDLELVALNDGQYKLMKKYIEDGFVDEIIRQSGILGETTPSMETIRTLGKAVLNVPFEGATWSENIWKKQDLLRLDIARLMSDTMMRGKNATTIVPELRQRFEVSEYEATRLAVTEQARVQTEGALLVFKEYGYDKFNLVPEPSACRLCKEVADDNPFLVKDMMIGENAPPIHPHCHCVVVPAVDEEKLNELFRKYENLKDAKILIDEAKNVEGKITGDLIDTAKQLGLSLAGLEYRIKSQESLARKLRDDPKKKVRDVLRYTALSSPENLASDTKTFLETMTESGYTVSDIKNTWLESLNPYKGINTNLLSSDGYEFELQFHTPESFDIKNNKLHKLYEEARVIKDKTSARYLQLIDKMFELSATLEVPRNIEEVRRDE